MKFYGLIYKGTLQRCGDQPYLYRTKAKAIAEKGSCKVARFELRRIQPNRRAK